MKSEMGSAKTLRGFCSQPKISQGKQMQETIFFFLTQLNEISKDESQQWMPHLGLFHCTGRMGGLQNRLTVNTRGMALPAFPTETIYRLYVNPDPYEDKFSKLKSKFLSV